MSFCQRQAVSLGVTELSILKDDEVLNHVVHIDDVKPAGESREKLSGLHDGDVKKCIDFCAQDVADSEENLSGSSSSSAQSLKSFVAPVNQHHDNPLGAFSGSGVVVAAGDPNAMSSGVYEKRTKSLADIATSYLSPC